MAVYRLQTSFGADTAFPRDRMVITPHFSVDQVLDGAGADQLCEDLATAMVAWCSGTREVIVKAYDAQGTPPVLPVGEAVRNAAVTPNSSHPREVAICLSFYSGQNVPSKRGRLYIPFCVMAGGLTLDGRVGLAARDKVQALVPIFTGLGGVNVDWSVYSRKNDTAHSVSNWFIDNEWDTIRSRGLRPDTRSSGSVSE